MDYALRLFGLDYTWWSAVDGRNLTEVGLKQLGVKQLPGYEDPFYRRPMKMGEIGCFLSHYNIWRDVVDNGLQRVLVFEDDLRFQAYAKQYLEAMVEDLNSNVDFHWDLIYLGRKRTEREGNRPVPGQRFLTTVGYSYWTLGYALSLAGAKKLLAAEPIGKMVAVDEYLPIMFGAHPRTDWVEAFPGHGQLNAFTTEPLIVLPERYTHQHGYISDTEDSKVIIASAVVPGAGPLPLGPPADVSMPGRSGFGKEEL